MNKNLKKLSENSRAELAVRWLLGLIFVYASYHKIEDPASFAKIIYGYGLFPEYSINLIAILLPFAELVAGMALIIGLYPRSAALIVNIMLFAFIVALTINLIRGHEFDCGCFSFGESGYSSSAAQLLVRDILCLMLGLLVFRYGNPRKWCIRTGRISPVGT